MQTVELIHELRVTIEFHGNKKKLKKEKKKQAIKIKIRHILLFNEAESGRLLN